MRLLAGTHDVIIPNPKVRMILARELETAIDICADETRQTTAAPTLRLPDIVLFFIAGQIVKTDAARNRTFGYMPPFNPGEFLYGLNYLNKGAARPPFEPFCDRFFLLSPGKIWNARGHARSLSATPTALGVPVGTSSSPIANAYLIFDGCLHSNQTVMQGPKLRFKVVDGTAQEQLADALQQVIEVRIWRVCFRRKGSNNGNPSCGKVTGHAVAPVGAKTASFLSFLMRG